jgi:hypothetical protein
MFITSYRIKTKIHDQERIYNGKRVFDNLGDCISYLEEEYNHSSISMEGDLYEWMVYDFEKEKCFSGSLLIQRGKSLIDLFLGNLDINQLKKEKGE